MENIDYCYSTETSLNKRNTMTPAMISPIPINPARSIFWSNTNTDTIAIAAIPTPDHIAYTTPIGIVSNVNDRK